MPFNASGIFQRLFNWRDDRDSGVKIRADRMDQEMDGIVQGLNDVLQGKANFNAPIRCVGGTAAKPAFSFSDQAGTGFFRRADGNIGLSVDGVEVGSFSASFFAEIVDHHSARDNPHEVTAEQVGALPAEAFTAENILAALLEIGGAGSGLDADLLDGSHKSDFVMNTREVEAGDGLKGGGPLSANVTLRADIASQQLAEEATNNTTLLTPLRAKQLLLANLAKVSSRFYGLKIEGDRLILDVGSGEYQAANYFWSDFGPPGLTFEINEDGHLVAKA